MRKTCSSPALDEDVGRLDVAVDEPALVGGVERRGDRVDDSRSVPRFERPLAVQDAAQIGAVDQVHRHEQQPVLLPRVVDRDDVRVSDRDRDPRLLGEAAAKTLVGGERRRDDLQRDEMVER